MLVILTFLLIVKLTHKFKLKLAKLTFHMKTLKITKIAKDLNVSHGAVSQWFSGETIPNYKNMLALNRKHKIPFTAWEDIKSYIESVPSKESPNKVCEGAN